MTGTVCERESGETAFEWEDVSLRGYLPPELHEVIGAQDDIVRVALIISAKIMRKHPEVHATLSNLTESLASWDAYTEQGSGIDRRLRIYLPETDDGHRVRIVLGVGNAGTTNVISIFLVRRRGWINEYLIQRKE